VVAEIFPVEVPPVAENATLEPPVVSKFPAASRLVRVRVTEFPEFTVAALRETVEVTSEIGPGRTCTVGDAVVTKEPPMVAWIVVAVPARTPVKVAV
jgi:hypothetical protein